MRRVRYAVAASLDGYVAGPKGEADWIVIDPDIDFRALTSEFDTVLVGGRTWEGMTAGGPAGKVFGMRTYVFSRTIDPAAYPEVTVVADHAPEIVAALREESGRDIWLYGGGLLFRSLLEAGVVDTVEVAVIPVLLGEGIPLYPSPGMRAKLRLTRHKLYPRTGTLGLEYAIAPPARHSRRSAPAGAFAVRSRAAH